MKKHILLILTLTLINIQSICAQNIPNIGDNWSRESSANVMVYAPPPLDFLKKASLVSDDVELTIGLAENKVAYIGTNDSTFLIKGNKYIGKPLSSFPNKENLIHIRGWGRYLPVQDGWNVAFSYKEITDSSRVIFLFKIKN